MRRQRPEQRPRLRVDAPGQERCDLGRERLEVEVEDLVRNRVEATARRRERLRHAAHPELEVVEERGRQCDCVFAFAQPPLDSQQVVGDLEPVGAQERETAVPDEGAVERGSVEEQLARRVVPPEPVLEVGLDRLEEGRRERRRLLREPRRAQRLARRVELVASRVEMPAPRRRERALAMLGVVEERRQLERREAPRELVVEEAGERWGTVRRRGPSGRRDDGRVQLAEEVSRRPHGRDRGPALSSRRRRA